MNAISTHKHTHTGAVSLSMFIDAINNNNINTNGVLTHTHLSCCLALMSTVRIFVFFYKTLASMAISRRTFLLQSARTHTHSKCCRCETCVCNLKCIFRVWLTRPRLNSPNFYTKSSKYVIGARGVWQK